MYKKVKISDFLHRRKELVVMEFDMEYSLVTIKLHHKGVLLREKKRGSQIGSSMFRISKGQFILSGIDARNGAFGIVPDFLDGAIITNDFWCFDVDETVVKRDFFYWFTNTPLFLDACIRSSKGDTQRVRLQKDLFFNFEFHFPSLDEQEIFLKRIESTNTRLIELNHNLLYQSENLTKLRQSVLQEAIEGKLTALWRKQNSKLITGENHASKLLEKIRVEKDRFINEGKIRKERLQLLITNDEIPFVIPEGWVWAYVSDLGASINYAIVDGPFGSHLVLTDYDKNGTFPVLTIGCIDEGFDLSRMRRINNEKYEQIKRSTIRGGDILIAKIGSSYGKIGEYPEGFPDGIIPANLLKLTLHGELNKIFVKYALKSPFFKKELDGITQFHAQPAFNVRNFKRLLFPIPPQKEQQEIAKRINGLFNIIDKLSEQSSERRNQSESLMRSVLREAFAE